MPASHYGQSLFGKVFLRRCILSLCLFLCLSTCLACTFFSFLSYYFSSELSSFSAALVLDLSPSLSPSRSFALLSSASVHQHLSIPRVCVSWRGVILGRGKSLVPLSASGVLQGPSGVAV